MSPNLDLAARIFHRFLEDPGSFPEDLTVIPLSLLAGGEEGLTPARLQLFATIRSHGPFTRLQELATAVGRGKHRVSKDVAVLASWGLVTKTRRGKTVEIAGVERPILLA